MMMTKTCSACGKPVTRPASEFRYTHAYCDKRCEFARRRILGPTPPDALPEQTFATADIKKFGAPQAKPYAKRLAWEQQRAAEWMALRGAQAIKDLIVAAYPDSQQRAA